MKIFRRLLSRTVIFGMVFNAFMLTIIAAPKAKAAAKAPAKAPAAKAPAAKAPAAVKSALGSTATGAGVYPEWKRKLYTNAFKFIAGDATISTVDKVTDGATTLTGYDTTYYSAQKKTDLGAIKTAKPTTGFTMTNYLSVLQKLGDMNSKFLNAAGAVQELGTNATKTGVVTYIGTGTTQNIKITSNGVDFYVFKQ